MRHDVGAWPLASRSKRYHASTWLAIHLVTSVASVGMASYARGLPSRKPSPRHADSWPWIAQRWFMRVTVVTRLTCVPGKAARSAAYEHTRTHAQTTRVQSYDRAGAVSALDCAVGAAAAAAAAEKETDAAQQNGEHAPAHAAGALESDVYATPASSTSSAYKFNKFDKPSAGCPPPSAGCRR